MYFKVLCLLVKGYAVVEGVCDIRDGVYYDASVTDFPIFSGRYSRLTWEFDDVDAARPQTAKQTTLELHHPDRLFVVTIKTGRFTSHGSHYRVTRYKMEPPW